MPRAASSPVPTCDPMKPRSSALLPRFIGVISQVPPVYSAIKIGGERAYDLARDGADVVMEPREIIVHRLALISSEPDLAIFEAECGKGTYVRAIARDLGRLLGCYGHVVLLRRTRVGPFSSDRSFTWIACAMGRRSVLGDTTH